MRKEISFWLLVLLFLAGSMALGYTAHAGTIVKSDGTITERTYKPSYMVRNTVELKDITDSKAAKSKKPKIAQWVVTSYPGSTIKTKRRPSKTTTIMGVLA